MHNSHDIWKDRGATYFWQSVGSVWHLHPCYCVQCICRRRGHEAEHWWCSVRMSLDTVHHETLWLLSQPVPRCWSFSTMSWWASASHEHCMTTRPTGRHRPPSSHTTDSLLAHLHHHHALTSQINSTTSYNIWRTNRCITYDSKCEHNKSTVLIQHVSRNCRHKLAHFKVGIDLYR